MIKVLKKLQGIKNGTNGGKIKAKRYIISDKHSKSRNFMTIKYPVLESKIRIRQR